MDLKGREDLETAEASLAVVGVRVVRPSQKAAAAAAALSKRLCIIFLV